MGDLLRYLRLTARARTGVSQGVLVGGAGFVWAGMASFLWLSITLFVAIGYRAWPWDWSNQWVFAGCMLTLGWAALTGALALYAMLARANAKKRADAALAAQKASLFDPSMITVGLEIGRAIGWRRLISLAGVVLMASGLAKEWVGRQGEEEPPAEEN